MAQFNNERLRGLRIGISSYTEDELVLDVIGNTSLIGILSASSVSSGIVTSAFFSGNGEALTGVRIGVQTIGSGGPIGLGASILDFRGDVVDVITVSSGIGTININTPISPVIMGMIF